MTSIMTPVDQSLRPVNLPRTDQMVKFAKDFTAGGWAAVVAKTIIAPVERVKLILQLQNAQSTIEVSKRYRGMVDCFVRVPREQGFLSFWRGNWSNILRASSQESLGMAFKEIFKKYLVTKDSDYTKFVAGNFMAGGLSGCATFCFIYPLDFSRTRLAIDMGKDASSREFNGLMDCLMKIGKHDGFFGLYRGFLPSLQYIFLYRATYYGLFDTLKVVAVDAGLAKHNDLSFSLAFAIAQLSVHRHHGSHALISPGHSPTTADDAGRQEGTCLQRDSRLCKGLSSLTMASLDERFEAAVKIVQNLPKNGPVSTTNDQKLEFYSLFKQATIGDVNTERPGFFSLVEKAKWDAWKAREGLSKEDAKEKYIEVLLLMFDKIGEVVNIKEWVNGPDLDPSVKDNLIILGKDL